MIEKNTALKWYKWLTALYLLSVLALCSINFGPSTDIDIDLFGIRTDHLAHFIMFFPMPFLLFGIHRYSALSVSLHRIVPLMILSLIFALLTELMQNYFIPWRSGELSDLVADTLAILTGGAVSAVYYLAAVKK